MNTGVFPLDLPSKFIAPVLRRRIQKNVSNGINRPNFRARHSVYWTLMFPGSIDIKALTVRACSGGLDTLCHQQPTAPHNRATTRI